MDWGYGAEDEAKGWCGLMELSIERKAQLASLPRWTWHALEFSWEENLASVKGSMATHNQVYPRRLGSDVSQAHHGVKSRRVNVRALV